MSKIYLFLCATILLAKLVLAAPENLEEELSQEVDAALAYQRAYLLEEAFFDLPEENDDEPEERKCRRPMQKCSKAQKCCLNMKCAKLIKRCLPKIQPPTPPKPNQDPQP